MCEVTCMDQVKKNEQVRWRTGVVSGFAGHAEQNKRRWHGRVQRKVENKFVKMIMGSDVIGVRLTGRLCMKWMEEIVERKGNVVE